MLELLEYLMKNERLVVPRDQLLEDAGYISLGETWNTVDVFVSNLAASSGVGGRAPAPVHGARRGVCPESPSKLRLVWRFDMLLIRWRLAVTSAILTFAILLAFALVIDFTVREMRSTSTTKSARTRSLLQERMRVERRSTVTRIDS